MNLLRKVLVTQCCTRPFTTLPGAAVKLSFDKYDAKRDTPGASPPVLILHGLFGSRQNWRAISKRLNADLNPYRPVFAIDARNHGLSPRSPEHNYDLLAKDLKELYAQLGINKAVVMGHSMGGRAMINFALKYPELVDKLIVVDITQLNMSRNSDQITEMLRILQNTKIDPNLGLAEARRTISEQLGKIGVNQATRDFVLLNLVKNPENGFEWRINVEGLMANAGDVFTFPQKSLGSKFLGETLFIAGADSDYVQRKDIGKIRINMPKAEFEFVERAGHLVHVEQPARFIEIVKQFLNQK